MEGPPKKLHTTTPTTDMVVLNNNNNNNLMVLPEKNKLDDFFIIDETHDIVEGTKKMFKYVDGISETTFKHIILKKLYNYAYNYAFTELYNELYNELIINPISFNPIHGLYSKFRDTIKEKKREFEDRLKHAERDYEDIKVEIIDTLNEICNAYTFFGIYFALLAYTFLNTFPILKKVFFRNQQKKILLELNNN